MELMESQLEDGEPSTEYVGSLLRRLGNYSTFVVVLHFSSLGL